MSMAEADLSCSAASEVSANLFVGSTSYKAEITRFPLGITHHASLSWAGTSHFPESYLELYCCGPKVTMRDGPGVKGEGGVGSGVWAEATVGRLLSRC